MAIIVTTEAPEELLAEIKTAIGNKRVKTWSVDAKGDFTHTPDPWRFRAWLRPRLDDGKLIFYIIRPKSVQLSKQIYAIYHGRFIEMLLAHFDTRFEGARATALATDEDRI